MCREKIFPASGMAEIFRAKVLSMLKKEGKIDDDLIRMLMGWRHTSGFSVDNGVQLARDDEEGKEALAQYILRNPFSSVQWLVACD